MPKIVDPEQRRTEIIHGLWAVIYERGIHAVTYQAVAQAAGVSVGRIQHYFDSKQDLVHAGCRAMVGAAAEAHEQRADSLEPLEALTELLLQPIPRSDAFRLGSAVWYVYLAQTVADPQIAEIIGGASRETLEYATSLLRSAGAPAPAHEAARLVALSNGLAQSVLIGALSPDRATDILGSEVASLRAAVNSTDADAGRPAPSTPSARKSSAQE